MASVIFPLQSRDPHMATVSILPLISSGCPQLRGLWSTTIPPHPQKRRPLSCCNWFVLNHRFCNLFTVATKSGQTLVPNGGRAELTRGLLAPQRDDQTVETSHPAQGTTPETGWLLPCRLVASAFARLILPVAVVLNKARQTLENFSARPLQAFRDLNVKGVAALLRV